jgi:hypothetical protein
MADMLRDRNETIASMRVRIRALEAALREIASYVGEDRQLDINAKNMREAAREALATAETKGDAGG